jgi:hypothetical protein
MTTIAADRVTLVLAGCMTPKQKADNDKRFNMTEEVLTKTQGARNHHL